MNLLPEGILASNKIVKETISFDWPEQFKEKLCFQRDLLRLLSDTNLFGPMIEKALEDIETLIQALDNIEVPRSFEIAIQISCPKNP